jgi:hypothetical protein
MERARLRTKPRLCLQRAFERSRLEEQLVTTAYELAVPPRRQSLSAPRGPGKDQGREQPCPVTEGGLSA